MGDSMQSAPRASGYGSARLARSLGRPEVARPWCASRARRSSSWSCASAARASACRGWRVRAWGLWAAAWVGPQLAPLSRDSIRFDSTPVPGATTMTTRLREQAGKVRSGVLLWALGVPIPIILIIWAIKGCAW